MNHWANVSQFRQSAGLGIACTVSNIESLLQSSPTKNPAGEGDESSTTGPKVILSPQWDDGQSSSTVVDIQFIGSSAFSSKPVEKMDGEDWPPSDGDPDQFQVVIGTEKWLAENGIPVEIAVTEAVSAERRSGSISVLCAANGRLVAVVSIVDEEKPEAALAVWSLHQMGIHVVLLTGDNAKTAENTAKKVKNYYISTKSITLF